MLVSFVWKLSVSITECFFSSLFFCVVFLRYLGYAGHGSVFYVVIDNNVRRVIDAQSVYMHAYTYIID